MGLSLLGIPSAYYMQKGGGWFQIACKIAYVLNGRPLNVIQMLYSSYDIAQHDNP